MTCSCRNCGKTYEEEKGKADFKGYCTNGCMKKKAKQLGWNEAAEKRLTLQQRMRFGRTDTMYANPEASQGCRQLAVHAECKTRSIMAA